MNAIKAFQVLGPIDAKSVRRDTLLRWMIFFPILIALLVRWLVPMLTGVFAESFNLTTYYTLIMSSFFVMLNPLMFGVVIGFLLLDERDDHTLSALQVTPIGLVNYVVYRTEIPMLLSIVMTMVSVPLAGFAQLPLGQLFLVALLAAPIAPIYALFLSVAAQNKVQGFAYVKAIQTVLMLPIAAFFIHSGWQVVFGLIPTYWAAKVFWLLSAGAHSVTEVSWYVLGGVGVQALLLALLVRRFNRVMYR